MQIVEVGLEDLQQLLSFSRRTFYTTFGDQNTPENMQLYDKEHFSENQMRSELLNPDSQFFFAKLGEEILGYIKINRGSAQTVLPNEEGIEIERIYVSLEAKGRGIGKSLIQKTVTLAKNTGAKYIWLGVWEQNTNAIRFYEKTGFYRFDKHIFYLGNDPQTDLLMKLAL
jgi:diamine N-acetyltransferase